MCEAARVLRRFLLIAVTFGVVLGAPSAAQAVTCADFTTQASAQYAGNTRDGDGDGIYCEALPCPCSTAPPGTSPAPVVVPTPTPVQPEPVAALPGARTAVRIVSVTDGDTIKVRLADGRRKTVRLIGIDTPETVKAQVPVECGGKSATAAMVKLALQRLRGRLIGRPAVIVSDPTQSTTDRYGRTLAYVQVSGRDIGKALVRAGLAAVYVYHGVPFARLTSYQLAADAAKREARGVWGSCGGDFHSAQ